MDFKAAIIKGIQTIQETAGSEEIKREWQSLIDEVIATDDDAKLAIMYQSFREVMQKTAGETVDPFKAKTPDGDVKTFFSVDEYLRAIGKPNA